MDTADNERLTPLVEIGYRIYRGEIGLPAPPPRPPEPPIAGRSEKAYREGLRREIEESYSSREGTLDYLVARTRDGSLAAFSETDCRAAVELLDALLVAGLLVESRHGDGPDAVRELRAEVPGLSSFLYADLLGYYAYINR